MVMLEISNICKSYGSVSAVDNVTFSVNQGEIICILGPSGCGKTTLLRLVAGIDNADSGTVKFGGITISDLPSQLRGFGLMFQDLALFPHMNVFGNISFGLRMQGLKPSDKHTRVNKLLDLVEMSNYGNRKVHELSGGERQRVALARSLAPEPRLLMLDEPLASLDRALRETLQGQVRNILKEIGLTSLYVTHDRDEAFSMADRLVFMNQGKVIQIGTPEEVFYNPADEFVARSVGFKNIFRGIITRENNMLEISSPLGKLHPPAKEDISITHGTEVMFLIDEREIIIHNLDCSHEPNSTQLEGVVSEKVFRTGVYELKILAGDVQVSFLSTPTQNLDSIQSGDKVTVDINPTAIRLISS